MNDKPVANISFSCPTGFVPKCNPFAGCFPIASIYKTKQGKIVLVKADKIPPPFSKFVKNIYTTKKLTLFLIRKKISKRKILNPLFLCKHKTKF